MYSIFWRFLFGLTLILFASCSQSNEPVPVFTEIDAPTSAGSGQPNMETDANGDVYLSWVESGEEKEHALKYAVLRAGDSSWEEPKTITQGDGWFVNWADFPSIAWMGDDRLAAHWLQKVPGEWYAYHVNIAFHDQQHETLSETIRPHLDESATEHGFVSLVPLNTDRLLAVWLDGREMADGHNSQNAQMTLRSAEVSPTGEIDNKKVIDGRVCECCQTSAVKIGESVIVAYRDRSEGEIRDISLSRYRDGEWSDPVIVHEDNWHFMGCPVNGPSLASSGDSGGVVWYTGSEDEARVYFAHIDEELQSIGEPVQINTGKALGRVDVVMQEGATAWVSWVEDSGEGTYNYLRRISPDGKASPAIKMHPLNSQRLSGFPRMALSGNRIIVSWTDLDESTKVRTGIVDLGR